MSYFFPSCSSLYWIFRLGYLPTTNSNVALICFRYLSFPQVIRIICLKLHVKKKMVNLIHFTSCLRKKSSFSWCGYFMKRIPLYQINESSVSRFHWHGNFTGCCRQNVLKSTEIKFVTSLSAFEIYSLTLSAVGGGR